MSLIRWNDPFAGLSTLHSQLDDIFNEALTKSGPSASATPSMDVYAEDDKQLVAEVEAPGFSKDDVEVSVHEGVLEIKGERSDTEEKKDKKRSYVVRESSASFYRRIGLPKYADSSKIEAHFDNGVLKVIVPFKELPAPKKVQISSKAKKDNK